MGIGKPCQVGYSTKFTPSCIGGSAPMEPHVVGAQLHRLSTVGENTGVLKPIHGKII